MWGDTLDDNLDAFQLDTLQSLSPIRPQFFIPRLVESPQNPILETLNTLKIRPVHPLNGLERHEKTRVYASTEREASKKASTYNIVHERQSKIASWDTLCTPPRGATVSPFLSEQDEPTFVSIRHHIKPRLRDDMVDIIHVSESQLLQSLKLNVLGSSSTLYTWDASSELFLLRGVQPGNHGVLIIDGKDDSVGKSVTQLFLTIGTLLHRLDNFVALLRREYALRGPTVNALSHTLATILKYLRESLHGVSVGTLSSLRMHYTPFHDTLLALSELCDREEHRTPTNYPVAEYSPRPLLSRIYQHLNKHVEMGSVRLIRAIFAYLITVISHDLTQQVCRSVGYGKQPATLSHVYGELVTSYQTLMMEANGEVDGNNSEVDDSSSDSLDSSEPFPPFFPPQLLEGLGAAQKSLKLLRSAQADHPILADAATYPDIIWFWREDQVLGAWNGDDAPPSLALDTLQLKHDTPELKEYPPPLLGLRIFDLEPGASLEPSPHNSYHTPVIALRNFIESFPENLPSLTPTLPQLCSLVFQPLIQYSSRLSSALLSLILKETSYLHITTHLRLLRSYMLLTSDGFMSRLAAALFSDSGDSKDAPGSHVLLARLHPTPRGREPESSTWPVGLAPTLLYRDTWPPVGTDLSFLLRTVIIDSLEPRISSDNVDLEAHGRRRIMEEAESRLGFAIRDLPADTGREKWLNPLTIEALDFLYMDYRPPHPLDVVITPDVLSKYQRVFAFLLRLLRVQCAIHAVFRMARPVPLFPTLTPSNKLLLHFRFIAQSFVSAVCAYSYDTVIGGNFDAFLTRLAPQADPTESGFTDIFALASAHSSLLDDILSALLLRSGQRNVGDLLRHALEIVLEFSILVGQLKRGDLQEYEAAPLLSDLHARFLAKMTILVRVLKGLNDKGQFSRAPIDVLAEKQPLRGVQCLQDLLLRLDLGNWWQHK